jgi:glycosyltransferase involved in cell wall biosynthesis
MEDSKNNHNPKVSVIIPTYNRPDFIGQAIKSVLNQTYQNFEIVIIDDSPNNETEKVVKNFNDPRINYIHNKEKGNMPKARNQGVKASSPESKYIAFLDDDDEYLPKFLEKTVKFLEENKDVVMVITHAELRTRDGKKIGEARCNWNVPFWQQPIGNGCVIRKEIFTKENLWYDEKKVLEDLDFGIRVLRNHKWYCFPEILRIYHCYPSPREVSGSSFLSIEEIEGFYKKHYELYHQLGPKAFAFFQNKIGREFLKSGEIKRGRKYLLKAFLVYPHPKYLLYYLIAFLFPGLFRDVRWRILKQKIFRGKI